ncbi:MAG: long-chain-fatty-acid--CoA ligase [Pseudomonadota bacterium]|nr:long-chain-fatty-acid--CoA ligase [Pseudomonadota bacterium]
MTQITQLLRRAVQTAPRRVATDHIGRTRLWSEFGERVARLAGALAGLGLAPGDRLGVLALNSDRYLEALFAAPWGGLVVVPVNTRLAPREVEFWLGDSECAGLLVDETFAEMAASLRPRLPRLKRLVFMGEGATPEGMLDYESLLSGAEPAADAGRGGDDLAALFYTGGTTGRSKGVMLSHRNIVANALNTAPALAGDAETIYLHAAPMFHAADNAVNFVVTAVGGKHLFMPRFDASVFLQRVAREKATATLIVPTMINMVVHHPDVETTDTSSLKRMLYGASPMPEALIRRAFVALPHTGFVQAYGQSEAAPCMTFLHPDRHVWEGPKAGKLKSAGQAALGCEIAILALDGREAARGEVGEICGRGDNVMLGYWRQPELTEKALRDGWLHTGDGGYMDEDGFVYVVDRMKDMIVSGGENVYSAEVEQALYQHIAVAECAVVGVPDPKWGEAVHAIVRLKPGAAATPETLIAHCHALIAGYKCPRSVTLRAEPLPVSGAGKILKTELRKPFWEGRERAVN